MANVTITSNTEVTEILITSSSKMDEITTTLNYLMDGMTLTVSSTEEISYKENSLLPSPECEREDMNECKCPLCETTLDEDTHIHCLENTIDDKDLTICSDCFWSEEKLLVEEGYYDVDNGEDSEGWGEDYGFVHPHASKSDEE